METRKSYRSRCRTNSGGVDGVVSQQNLYKINKHIDNFVKSTSSEVYPLDGEANQVRLSLTTENSLAASLIPLSEHLLGTICLATLGGL